jgi:hypothetical protein
LALDGRMKVLKALQGLSNTGTQAQIFLKNGIILALLFWNVLEGSVYENVYPTVFVKLYTVPIWRLLLVLFMIVAAEWNHSIGIMLAFTIFFYVMDMEVTMEKWN